MCSFAFLVRHLLRSFFCFNWVVCILTVEFSGSWGFFLMYFGYKFSSETWFANTISQSVAGLFILSIFAEQMF
jgi:hypothetical protein